MATKKKVSVKKEKKVVLKPGEPVNLEVTKEVYFFNSEFFEANGISLGDKVEVSEATLAELKFPKGHPFAKEPEVKKTVGAVEAKVPSKITCPIAILKGDEFVRVYPKGQESEALEFLGKNPNYRSMSPDKLVSISVQWRENEKKKDSETNRIVDTGRLVTKNHIFSEKNNGSEWFKEARQLANEGPRRSCVATVKGELKS